MSVSMHSPLSAGPRTPWMRYALGLVVLVIALPLSYGLQLLTHGQFPLLVPFLAVIVTATIAGSGPALGVALLSLIAVDLTRLGPAPTYNQVIFVIGCALGLPLIRQLQIARAKALEGRRAEQESQRQLREASRQKDEFLAILAHELRNPLAPIRTATQILRAPTATPEQRDAAQDIILRQVNHLVRLIDDLMDVSRINSGKLELRKQRIRIADALHSAVETSRPLIDERKQTLSVSLPADPIPIDGDLTRVAQVIANLLNNASRYSPPGSRIELTVRNVSGQVEIAVKDEGIGMAPELLACIWDMFVQGDKRLERNTGGLGVGLTLVQRIVHMHGGSVEARSEGENRGSEFIVRLPIPAFEP